MNIKQGTTQKKVGTYTPKPRTKVSDEEKKARQKIYNDRFQAKRKALREAQKALQK